MKSHNRLCRDFVNNICKLEHTYICPITGDEILVDGSTIYTPPSGRPALPSRYWPCSSATSLKSYLKSVLDKTGYPSLLDYTRPISDEESS